MNGRIEITVAESSVYARLSQSPVHISTTGGLFLLLLLYPFLHPSHDSKVLALSRGRVGWLGGLLLRFCCVPLCVGGLLLFLLACLLRILRLYGNGEMDSCCHALLLRVFLRPVVTARLSYRRPMIWWDAQADCGDGSRAPYGPTHSSYPAVRYLTQLRHAVPRAELSPRC